MSISISTKFQTNTSKNKADLASELPLVPRVVIDGLVTKCRQSGLCFTECERFFFLLKFILSRPQAHFEGKCTWSVIGFLVRTRLVLVRRRDISTPSEQLVSCINISLKAGKRIVLYAVCSDEGLTLETSATHHIPQATNIPYQLLSIEPLFCMIRFHYIK